MSPDGQGLFKWLSNVVCAYFFKRLLDTHSPPCRINSVSRSYQAFPQHRKRRRNLLRRLGSSVRRNVSALYRAQYLVCEPLAERKLLGRWQILGLHVRLGERRHCIYHPRPWGAYRQHLLCMSFLHCYSSSPHTN